MKANRITQRQIAGALGITEGAISQKFSALRGGRRAFSLDQGREIARLVSEQTGRSYSVEQLFYSEAGAA